MPFYAVEIEHRDDDQVFSYYHDSKMLHFNASLLNRLRPQVPRGFTRITLDLTDAEYDLVMKHRGIEEPKIEALRPCDLREPGLGVFFDDGLFTVVDGHHRLVRRYRGGVRVMDFWTCHSDVWRHVLVDYSAEAEAILAQAIPARVDHPTTLVSRASFTMPPEDRKKR